MAPHYKRRIYGKTKHIDTDILKEMFSDSRLAFVQMAALFGSRAQGKESMTSDYDLALVMRPDADEGWGASARAWDALCDVTGLSCEDIDVVDVLKASDAMKASIAEGYILLKGSEDEFSKLLRSDTKHSDH